MNDFGWRHPGLMGPKGLAEETLKKIDPNNTIGELANKPLVTGPQVPEPMPASQPAPTQQPTPAQPPISTKKVGVRDVNEVSEPTFQNDPMRSIGNIQQKMAETGQEIDKKYGEMADMQEATAGEMARMNEMRRQVEEESALEIKDTEARAKMFNLTDSEYSRVQDIERKIDMGEATEQDIALHKKLTERGQEIGQWTGMGTGSKIMAALSVAMGAIGSGLNGGPNIAIDMLNKTLDENVRRQMGRREDFNKRIGLAKDEADREIEAFDRQSAEFKAMKAGQLGAIQTRIEGLMKNTANQEAQGNLVQLSERIGMDRQRLLQEAAQQKSQEKLANRRLNLQAQQFNAQQDMRREQMYAGQQAAQAEAVAQDKNLGARGFKRKEGAQVSKEEVKKASEGAGQFETAMNILEDIKKFNEKEGRSVSPGWDSDAEIKGRALMSRFYTAAKEAQKLGVLAGPDMDLLTDQLGDPTSWRQDAFKANLKQVEKELLQGYSKSMDRIGLIDNKWYKRYLESEADEKVDIDYK